MKKLIFSLLDFGIWSRYLSGLILVFAPLFLKAQAHLGSSLHEIRTLHPDNIFSLDYTSDSSLYATTKMPLGTFAYYFDKTTGLSTLCIQIPNNMTDLNTQVEIYNQKYVVKSKTEWLAYLEGGTMMSIKLKYDSKDEMYEFIYTSAD
jgi:hypothetical protein